MFGTLLVSLTTFLHFYVFLRLASLPVIRQHVPMKVLIGAGLVLWLLLFLGWVFDHSTGILATVMVFLSMTWLATVYLLFICVFAVDVVTLFGLILPSLASIMRGWAFMAGLMLAGIALFQGMRPPIVQEYGIVMQDWPKELDGDSYHGAVGHAFGIPDREALAVGRVKQVQAQNPDMVLLLGDIFEGHDPASSQFIETMHRFSAPMGVWGVTGNHEYQGGGNADIMKHAGINLLRDQWVEISPGFVLAGVDDIYNRRRRGVADEAVSGPFQTGRQVPPYFFPTVRYLQKRRPWREWISCCPAIRTADRYGRLLMWPNGSTGCWQGSMMWMG